MPRVFCRWTLTGTLAILAAALCQAADRGVPASHGITNFGQVNGHLYRGAQPNAAGLASLKQLGVKTIICLRMPDDLWAPEKADATSDGMTFIKPSPERRGQAGGRRRDAGSLHHCEVSRCGICALRARVRPHWHDHRLLPDSA